jgi:hypothetical protein
MGSDSSKHTGGDFDKAKRDREANEFADNLPLIPFDRKQTITDEITKVLKGSIWLANFKRAFRGYLRRNPERTQQGTMLRIHHSSLENADELGLEGKDSYATLIKIMTFRAGGLWFADAKEFLQDKGKITKQMTDDEAQTVTNKAISIVFRQMADSLVQAAGKKLYDKYSRGADFEVSDTELDGEARRRQQEEKEAKLKAQTAERMREAQEWQAAAEAEQRAQEAREAEVKRRTEEQAAIRNQLL